MGNALECGFMPNCRWSRSDQVETLEKPSTVECIDVPAKNSPLPADQILALFKRAMELQKEEASRVENEKNIESPCKLGLQEQNVIPAVSDASIDNKKPVVIGQHKKGDIN